MGKSNFFNLSIRQFGSYINAGGSFAEFLSEIDEFQQRAVQELKAQGECEQTAQAHIFKISNLLVGKYQYKHKHDYMLARPYALIVDPSNGCPLHCQGCLHNNKFRKKIGPDWPAGILTLEAFEQFIRNFGPYATNILLYNWGEPLLNKDTPEFVKMAKQYLLHTSLSSNLSVEFDAEALVLSGLDYMILSVDGISQDSYGKYRKGGDLELAKYNIRKLVEAKKKFGLSTPLLSWQFLLFDHNKHEVDSVKEMAVGLGVNEVKFSHPYDIIWEGDLKAAKDIAPETFVVGYEGDNKLRSLNSEVENLKNLEDEFAIKWKDRLPEDKSVGFHGREGRTCKWLYTSLVMDARERFLPCCYVPRKDSGFTWVFADDKSNEDPFNSQFYRFSRQHFVWLSELKKTGGITPQLKDGKCATYCTACQDKNAKPLVNDEHLERYLQQLDNFGLLSEESVRIISNWDD